MKDEGGVIIMESTQMMQSKLLIQRRMQPFVARLSKDNVILFGLLAFLSVVMTLFILMHFGQC